jgi:hypothetical protein
MKARGESLILAVLLFGGCRATRDVAVTSYHVTRGAAVGSYRVTRAVAVGSYRVATAPVRLIRGHSGDSQTTTTTTATVSDVATPGYSVPAPSTVSSQPVQRQPRTVSDQQRVTSSNAAPTATPSERLATNPKTPRTTAAQPQFPVGKPVPGHAGLVYNPFDPSGGFIDVSGYPPGTKVKDPDSQKIFIVP